MRHGDNGHGTVSLRLRRCEWIQICLAIKTAKCLLLSRCRFVTDEQFSYESNERNLAVQSPTVKSPPIVFSQMYCKKNSHRPLSNFSR